MGSEQELGTSLVAKKKAEIDTRAPFQSVKEAVSLFGNQILVGEEVYASKFKQNHIEENQILQDPASSSRLGTVAAELEETKLSLHKAKEETMIMAHCLSSLQEELEKTKRELKQLKLAETDKQLILSEIDEDVKIIDDSNHFQFKKQATINKEDVDFGFDFGLKKKRFVTFANPVSVAHVIIPPSVEALERRHPSLRKKKKKKPLHLIGGIFSKKKASHEIHFA